MHNGNEIVIVRRDCVGYLVPSAAEINLPKGTEVMITQSLGGNYTVNVYGNLVMINNKDADALGRDPVVSPADQLGEGATIEQRIWAQIKSVYDPEIPVNIVDLGLVYDCQLITKEDDRHDVKVIMTLTAAGCGMGPVIAEDVKLKISLLKEIDQVEVEVVLDPPWTRDLMSDEAKLELGMM